MSNLTGCDFCKGIVGRDGVKYGNPITFHLGNAKKYYHCCLTCSDERNIGRYSVAEEVVQATLEETIRMFIREEMECAHE